MVRAGIVGHDPYTLPIVEALGRQPDVEVIGAYNHDVTPFSRPISRRTNIYCSESNFHHFKERGIKVSGFLDDFIEETDYFLEYDYQGLSMRISYGSSGMMIGPHEILLERLSAALPLDLKDISIESIQEELFCCPHYRAARLSMRLADRLTVTGIKESLLSAPRSTGISGEVHIRDLCTSLPFLSPQSVYSINFMLDSPEIRDNEMSVMSLIGYLLPLPEVIDTLRESEGMRRELSMAITDEHLGIAGGLIV